MSKPSLIKGNPSTILEDYKDVTLIDLLLRSAEAHASKGIRIYDRRGSDYIRRSYPEVMNGIQVAAAKLKAHGIKQGHKVLVALPTCWELLDLWMGCVYLGAFPAAIAPPVGGLGTSSNFTQRLERFRTVIDANCLICSDNLIAELEGKEMQSLKQIAISPESLYKLNHNELPELCRVSSDDLAFLQFTSGSTGMPRAVMIKHKTLVHNVYSINFGNGPPYGNRAQEWCESYVTWLPLNHDMGLIGSTFAIASGLELYLMNPTTFLIRPFKWFEIASGQKFISPAPNFGYQFCVERLKENQLDGIDMSQPRRFCIGSEMIRPETMKGFLKKLESTGFKAEHLCPCYGMAETTVALTFDETGQGIRVASPDVGEGEKVIEPVVCVGTPIIDTEIRIVDSNNVIVPQGKSGFIQTNSPSVFSGYYHNEEATKATFSDGWLITGDLGFIKDDELYIIGRSKEVLIIRGENIMPHDIEWQAEEVRGRGGAERCAAFSIVRGDAGEEPMIVMETSLSDPEELKVLEDGIRSRVGRVMNLVLADFVFIRRGQIPKTTSGKVRRSVLKEDYLQGRLDRLN